MAAGLGFKTFTTGEVLTAADTNGYLMQGINVFASSAARAAAITSPQEGQYSFLKDTNALEYYDGAAWVGAPVGDITGVTAGTGISGGGTSGTVTITNSMATEIAAKGDLIVGTGAATFDNLTVGTNGQILVADSSTATGLKWATASSGGAVLQVKNAKASAYQQITATSLTDLTSLTVAITPSSASNKVLVLVSVNGISAGAPGPYRARIALTDGSGTVLAYLNDYNVSALTMTSYSLSFLDSPATTSSKTYKLMGLTNASENFYVQNYQSVAVTSTITVMEVTP